ncbi:MAG: CHAT domain-containing protein, partial [Pseudomonadota bacterium]
AITKMGARLGASDPKLAKLVRERQDIGETWDKLDEEMLAAVSRPKAKRDTKREAELRNQLADLKQRFTGIDKRIAVAFPGYAELVAPRPLTRDELVSLAKRRSNEVLFYFDVADRWIDQWIVDPQADKPVRWRRVNVSRKVLRAKVHALRCGLDGGEWVGDVKPLKCLEATGQMPVDGRLPFKTETAQELFKVLFGPFKKRLEDREVLIVADDVLSSLPFQVLLTSAHGGDDLQKAPWFGLENPISVYPTVASLKTLRRSENASRASKAYFGVGNPLLTGRDGKDRSAWTKTSCPAITDPNARRVALAKFEQAPAVRAAGQAAILSGGTLSVADRVRRLAPLPETADELCAVADTVGRSASRVVLGDQATEADIAARNASGELADYRVVHFATHGLVAGELNGLVEPALVMTPPTLVAGTEGSDDLNDGLLTATEVAGLRLDADWVVLSACNTAAGDAAGGEALSGLARSFFYAGARSMLVSHWPVQSDAAVALTTVALAEMRTDPSVGRAEALRRAMVALVRSGGADAAHPQVWAPFVVVGEGGVLEPVGVDDPGAAQSRLSTLSVGSGLRSGAAPSETGALSPSSIQTQFGGQPLVLPVRRPEVPKSFIGRKTIQSLRTSQSRKARTVR